ncbi:uncharacterized protein LOC125650945 isoform X2 [Ostrea edulis]|uniref:uncharacterized protein LOC125650945 isoform X2 n=1 Tax=Ostrea edulis TaxID=37623 RepID=UPI0024AEAE82|nr:uncharacterized protein LOC125650945 isoform X2 [Ostrea edulis]
MKNKSMWKHCLELIKNSPSSQKSSYSKSAIIVLLGIIIVRCVSVAYFVMGLVWKLHTGVINENWIKVLNRLWIGNLQLGVTVNALVLTTVCLFPVYIICGFYGLLGIFCRKKFFIVLYMVSLMVFILADMIFFSLYVVLLDGIGGSLATNFQNIYIQMAQLYRTYPYTDVMGITEDWITMFSTLGCCGVSSQYSAYSYECSGYTEGMICWGKFSAIMGSYLTSYAGLAGTCLITEIVQLVMCDLIYSQMSPTKFPFALPRTCITILRTSWKRSRHAFLANIIRLMTCVPAISLLVLGTMLLTDSKLSGTYTSGIYTNIYILGHKFTNIVEGLGVLMIVQGSLEFLLNTTSFISDVVLHSKSKSILITVIKILMMISKITSLGLVIKVAVQVNSDLRFKMANLMRNFSSLQRQWLNLFGELECCGVTTSNDLCTMASSYCSQNLPYTCCQHDLYAVSENTIYSTLTCTSPNTPCLDAVYYRFRWYTTGYFIGISFSLLLGGLGIIFTVLHVRSLRVKDAAPETKQNENDSESEIDKKSSPSISLGRRVITCILNHKYLTTELMTSIMLLTIALGLFVEGFVLTYDKVFNHEIIRDVLWEAITFEGFSFNNLRQSFAHFMISSALWIAVVSGTGLFIQRTRSKYLHIMQMILISLTCSLGIVGVGLWGKAYSMVCSRLESEMSSFLTTHGYDENIGYLFGNVASSAWSNLFAVAECCGVSDYAGTELTGTTKQIPIYCCKENPLTEPYIVSNDQCTDFLQADLQHNKSCKCAILTRLKDYSISFFVLTSLMIAILIIQFITTIIKLRKVAFIPLNGDKFFRMTKMLCKTKKPYREIFTFQKRMILTMTTIILYLSMMVIGIVMKHDDKMTGQYVQNVHRYLHFNGVNFTDIVEEMYLSFIIIGALSVVIALLKLSDTIKELQNRTKIKMYIGGLVILILTKVIFVFMMIATRVDVDNNASYQLTNMDRQYYNQHSFYIPNLGYVRMFQVLNRFYLAFDCCGADGPYALSNLRNTGGYSVYSSLSGSQPYACCNGSSYADSTQMHSSIVCEKRSCTPEFLDKIDSYSDAYLATMTLAVFFEFQVYSQRSSEKNYVWDSWSYFTFVAISRTPR